MTPLARGVLGACLGGLFVILAHPVSRSVTLLPFKNHQVFETIEQQALVHQSDNLPAPNGDVELAFWCQIAGEQVVKGPGLSVEEQRSLKTLLDSTIGIGTQRRRDNAYWYQMASVVARQVGDGPGAVRYWMQGGKCSGWNDLQSERLQRASELVTNYLGMTPAWTYAWLRYDRSETYSELITSHSRWLLDYAETHPDQELNIRMANLENGSLVRSQAHSIKMVLCGANLVEEACHSADIRRMTKVASVKKLFTAQIDFLALLRKNGRSQDASQADLAFQNNDAWMALTPESPAETNTNWLATEGAFLAALPAGLLMGAIAGMMWWGLGRWLMRVDVGRVSYRKFVEPALAGGLIVLTYLLTRVAFLAFSIGACSLFLLYTPSNLRRARLSTLGPMFDALLIFVVVLFVASCLTLGLAFHPAHELVLADSNKGLYELTRPQAAMSYFTLTLCLVMLMSPIWAHIKRLPSLWVFALTNRALGKALFFTNLIALAICVPAYILVNARLSKDLREIMLNEPLHYYNRVHDSSRTES